MRCRILVAIASIASLSSGCSGGGPPSADRCSPGSTSGIDTLQIGPGNFGDDDPSGFTAYHDRDSGDYAAGGQGLSMLRVRLRVTGAAAPACLEQESIVSGVDLGGRDGVPRKTYPQPDGSRVTRPIYVILSGRPAITARLATTVGARSVAVQLGDFIADGGRD